MSSVQALTEQRMDAIKGSTHDSLVALETEFLRAKNKDPSRGMTDILFSENDRTNMDWIVSWPAIWSLLRAHDAHRRASYVFNRKPGFDSNKLRSCKTVRLRNKFHAKNESLQYPT